MTQSKEFIDRYFDVIDEAWNAEKKRTVLSTAVAQPKSLLPPLWRTFFLRSFGKRLLAVIVAARNGART